MAISGYVSNEPAQHFLQVFNDATGSEIKFLPYIDIVKKISVERRTKSDQWIEWQYPLLNCKTWHRVHFKIDLSSLTDNLQQKPSDVQLLFFSKSPSCQNCQPFYAWDSKAVGKDRTCPLPWFTVNKSILKGQLLFKFHKGSISIKLHNLWFLGLKINNLILSHLVEDILSVSSMKQVNTIQRYPSTRLINTFWRKKLFELTSGSETKKRKIEEAKETDGDIETLMTGQIDPKSYEIPSASYNGSPEPELTQESVLHLLKSRRLENSFNLYIPTQEIGDVDTSKALIHSQQSEVIGKMLEIMKQKITDFEHVITKLDYGPLNSFTYQTFIKKNEELFKQANVLISEEK